MKLLLTKTFKFILIALNSIMLLILLTSCHKKSTPKPGDGTGWQFAATNTTGNIVDVQFVSADTGYFLGYEHGVPFLSVSTDGGMNWHLLKQFDNFPTFTCFYAINSKKLIIARDTIYLSVDGGNTFTKAPGQTNASSIQKFQFFNNSSGFALTSSNIYQTADLQTWSLVHSANYGSGYNFINFPTPGTGYIGGGTVVEYNSQLSVTSYGLLAKTNDGGKSWNDLNFGSWTNNTQNFHRIVGMCFIDINRGYLATDDQKLLQTSDGGASWKTLNSTLPGAVNGLLFQSAQIGYYIISNNIYSTNNGGISFSNVFTATGNLNSICNGKNGKVYVAGENGAILINGS